jgi:hypothetical protein
LTKKDAVEKLRTPTSTPKPKRKTVHAKNVGSPKQLGAKNTIG